MAEKQRWIAMYTKHIKQKRKVYHDGFLDLQITRKKVMLYDEADNLLESRMLKADEVVSSGATLTFQTYLVDICDPKEGTTSSSDPKLQPNDQGCGRKPFALLRPNFNKTSLHSGIMSFDPNSHCFLTTSPLIPLLFLAQERKPKFVDKFPSKSLSPSHKMIRVFKKRELHKYASLSPDTVKPSTKGTAPLGSAGKGSDDYPLINSPCDDSRLGNDKLRKNVPPHKPLRDVNQILSILQRRNVTESRCDNKLQTSMSPTKVGSESDTRKSHKVESISSSAASRDSLPQQLMVREASSARKTDCSITHLNDPPSFDLGI